VGLKLDLLRNGGNSLWLSRRREVNGAKYQGRALGLRQLWWRMPKAGGSPPCVPEHTHGSR